MIFDYNEKKAKELSKRDPIRYAAKIAELQSGPRWYVRYYQDGVPHDEPCPPDYQESRERAEAYEKIVVGRIASETWVGIPVRAASISIMCDYYLAKKEERYSRKKKNGGLSSAKTHCRYLQRSHISHLTFGECTNDPELLGRYVSKLPRLHSEWSQKYIWNHVKILRAVFGMWVKKRLLDGRNPMDAVDDPEEGTQVIEYVPTDDDYQKIIAAGLVEGIRPDALRLIGAVRYTGFRVNEVLAWRVEDVELEPSEGLPFLWVVISKQKRLVRVPRPIRKELATILREQIGNREGGPVWPWKNPPYELLSVCTMEKKMTKDGKMRMVVTKRRKLYDIAAVQVPRPFHDFRKTVKMELKRTLDTKRAQAYQGHQSESMDDWYTWWQREDLEEAVERSYGINRGPNRGPK